MNAPLPTIKGWCPGALRPMMSGDGLIVRVRPRLARLTRDQVLGLCEAALTYGSGLIDLTSRANLQIRGISEVDHPPLIEALAALDLLDGNAQTESRRNVLCAPDWQSGDLTARLYQAVAARLDRFPALPAKMGIAIDTGAVPVLAEISADFRFERTSDGSLILRADGADMGRPITEAEAMDALQAMMDWFVKTGGPANKRMAGHVAKTPLPEAWTQAGTQACPAPAALNPGKHALGSLFGAPFGQVDARALQALMEASGARALRVTPWRLFLLEGARDCHPHGFVTRADDPLLRAHACPGKPFCASASVETRALATKLASRLAPRTDKTLHVSGCAKGCAHPRIAAITLVGSNGAYDLVREGTPWATPNQTGLSATTLTTLDL